MQTVQLALNAMATRFEILLHGEDPVALRAAGEEALAEVKRLHQRLSFYDPSSTVSHINRMASHSPVQVPPNLFSLFELSQDIYHKTDHAFDITIGPLVKTWGFFGASGQYPTDAAQCEAMEKTGMDKVTLNDQNYTIAFERDGMAIDLGAIGKGYAIEEAARILLECGITSALIHGGTSTMAAIGVPSPEDDGWPIGVVDPQEPTRVLTSIRISNESLSVSAPHGKAFKKDGKLWGHVIDPRLGTPVQGASLSAVSHLSATVADALSTALLAMDRTEIPHIAKKFTGFRILTVYTDQDEQNSVSIGFPSIESNIHSPHENS